MKMYRCVVDGTFLRDDGIRREFHHEDAYFASCVSDVEKAVLERIGPCAKHLGWDDCEITKMSVVACY